MKRRSRANRSPSKSKPQPLADADLAAGDRTNIAFAGTAVTYGRGRAVVVATGMNTEFGKIARMLQGVEQSRTPLQENLDRVGRMLAVVALVIVVVIVALGLWRREETEQTVTELLLFGVALAVAVVPEALPAVVTVSLAIGVQRMIKRNALVRRLPAVETLGSTSVICSDKTGTLTKDEMTVRQLYVAGRTFEVSGAGYEPKGEFSTDGNNVEPPEAAARAAQSGRPVVRRPPDARRRGRPLAHPGRSDRRGTGRRGGESRACTSRSSKRSCRASMRSPSAPNRSG